MSVDTWFLSLSFPGDTHLAMFRVSKVEDVKPADTVGETEIELDTDNKSDDTETSWTSSCSVHVMLCIVKINKWKFWLWLSKTINV